MRQFGSTLVHASFWGNLLQSIEADVFEFNINLAFISFSQNPLKFISPEFFKNLKSLIHLENVWISDSNCINQRFYPADNMQTFEWRYSGCSDHSVRVENDYSTAMTVEFFSNRLNCLEDTIEHFIGDVRKDIKSMEEMMMQQIDMQNEKMIKNKNNFNCKMSTVDEKLDRIIKLVR